MPESRDTRTTHDEERPALRLSFSQLTAACLATVSGALAASFLGIYGTIIGTAVMSVISTTGGVVYQHYLDRTRKRLRVTRVGKQRTGVSRLGLRRRWRAVAGVAGSAVLVFGFAAGIISVMESLADKPAAEIVSGQPGSGTTVGWTMEGPSGGDASTSQSTPAPATPVPDDPRPSAPGRASDDPAVSPSPPQRPATSPTPETSADEGDSDDTLSDRGAPPTP